jgi:hypothetical protein
MKFILGTTKVFAHKDFQNDMNVIEYYLYDKKALKKMNFRAFFCFNNTTTFLF